MSKDERMMLWPNGTEPHFENDLCEETGCFPMPAPTPEPEAREAVEEQFRAFQQSRAKIVDFALAYSAELKERQEP